MSRYATTIGNVVYHFHDLKTLLAKASPRRSGDDLAGLSAASAEERVAAQMALGCTGWELKRRTPSPDAIIDAELSATPHAPAAKRHMRRQR